MTKVGLFPACGKLENRLQISHFWAVSSVGRAPARQAGGHWFEPSTAHEFSSGFAASRLVRVKPDVRERAASCR